MGRRYASEERTLRLLDRYLIERGVRRVEDITPDVVDAFMASRPRMRPRSYNSLLGIVAHLFRWLSDQEIVAQSPVRAKPKRNADPRIPFIFDRSMAQRILELARALKDNPRATMRGRTYHVIFAVMYGLGLRVGEVSRLLVKDVEFERRLLVVRETKFYKSRLVPFGPKMQALLREFLRSRIERDGDLGREGPLITFDGRNALRANSISRTFQGMVPQMDLQVPPGCQSPRLHHLRHSFAVGTLLRWYRTEEDPGAHLLKLATFLGHVGLKSTAVYLTITKEILDQANRRFEAFAQPVLQEGPAQ